MRRILALNLLLPLFVLAGISLASAAQIDTNQQPSPATAEIPVTPAATPTIDRLAAPPTVYPPTQADDGAQLFWLYCQPCHGDKGQGLTDEWREQYPEDHQNCWLGGCHGKSPYPNGFALPTAVPAVIGEGSLYRYATMGQVFNFIRAKMPFEHPGVLTDDEYLAITAFLARSHDAWDGTRLTLNNVEQVRLQPIVPPEKGQESSEVPNIPPEELVETSVIAEDNLQTRENRPVMNEPFIWWGIVLILIIVAGGWLLFQLK
jgi:mono/diheme cytochrome c family protein